MEINQLLVIAKVKAQPKVIKLKLKVFGKVLAKTMESLQNMFLGLEMETKELEQKKYPQVGQRVLLEG